MRVWTPSAYIIVAGICLLLHNIVMVVADNRGVPLWLAVLISFGLVASTGYTLHGLFTFRQRLALSAFARYAIAMAANLPLAFATTWIWHDLLGLAMILAAPIATVCMVVFNFFLSRWAITPGVGSTARQ